MNLKEGTRRLALLLGVVGALLGGFLSYSLLQSNLQERAEHRQFEHLEASKAVQQDRQYLKDDSNGEGPFDPIQKFIALSHEDQMAVLQKLAPGKQDELLNSIRALRASGIKTIDWTKDLKIASIETQDGQILFPTPAPGAWSYVAIAFLPLLGFFIPWGAVRAIGWVGTGFVAGPT